MATLCLIVLYLRFAPVAGVSASPLRLFAIGGLFIALLTALQRRITSET